MPTSDNVVIKIQEEEQSNTTASGIYIPKTNNQVRPDRGIVVAVGTGRVLNSGTVLPCVAEVGDDVLFNKFAGTEIVTPEGKFLMIKENDILAIITE